MFTESNPQIGGSTNIKCWFKWFFGCCFFFHLDIQDSLNYTDSQNIQLENKISLKSHQQPRSGFEKSGTCGPKSYWEIPVRTQRPTFSHP